MFEGYELQRIAIDDVDLRVRIGGPKDAPPLLLLHGFPQTHAMWHRVARRLDDRFRLVLPDLRGYGGSTKPPGTPDHANYSKRRMAADVHGLMVGLGHPRYAVGAHDRGARVAHRLALDQPDAVARLALLDICPTLDMYASTDQAFATAYYHWFHLIQPAPLPETMIGGDARSYLHAKLGGWGSLGLAHLEPKALADYERGFCSPEGIHAACEDYRASAGIDLEHDRASRAAGERIRCETLIGWGRRGVIERLFDPPTLWQAQCEQPIRTRIFDAGHYLAEECPEETAVSFGAFFCAAD